MVEALYSFVFRGKSFLGACFLATLLLISGCSPPQSKEAGIFWLSNHDDALREAQKKKAPLMVEFTADWCLPCVELKEKTYTAPLVWRESRRFVALRIDAKNMDEDMDRLFARYQVLQLPTIRFVDAKGVLLDEPKILGFLPPHQFVEVLRRVK